MREKRRKIPLEVILATPVSEHRKRHGKQVFAARLCKQGKLEQAQAYCAKNGLPFPPFSEKTLGMTTFTEGDRVTMPDGTTAVCVGMTKPLSDGAREAGPVVREDVIPREVATGDIAPSESLSGVSHAIQGEPEGGVRYAPHETAAPASRKATVWAFCPNPRLVKIKFDDAENEFASLWATRPFRLKDHLSVEVERGSGPNAIWQEVKRRV
jgi:hypothetical protein